MNYLAVILFQFFNDKEYMAEFKKILKYVRANFFLHVIDKNDILADVKKFHEESAVKEIQR